MPLPTAPTSQRVTDKRQHCIDSKQYIKESQEIILKQQHKFDGIPGTSLSNAFVEMEFALRDIGLDAEMLAAIHDILDYPETEKSQHHPSRAYVRDAKATRATVADVLEYPKTYEFIVDMPGTKPDQIGVHVEDDTVLVVTGERWRDKEREQKEGVKYVRMERRQGKFMKRFQLPENADMDSVSANYQDGVLTISVQKKPPPEPKKPRRVEIQVKGGGQSQVGVSDGTETKGAGGGGRAEGGGVADGEKSWHESAGAQGDGNTETKGGGGRAEGGGVTDEGKAWHESAGAQGEGTAETQGQGPRR